MLECVVNVSEGRNPSAIAAFSAIHLIDDFLIGVPAEFNLTVPVTLLLAFAYMAALVGLVAIREDA